MTWYNALQLDTFHALWSRYPPCSEQALATPIVRLKAYAPFSRREARGRCPIATRVVISCTTGTCGKLSFDLVGRSYDVCSPYWY